MTDSYLQIAPVVDSMPLEPMSELEQELRRRLDTGRAALPVLPHVAASALKLAADQRANVEELARLVDTDPPIAARFLSVANSAIYWRGFNASTTQAAIVRLGLARTRDLLFQIVYANTTVGLKRYQAVVRDSFDRSVRCAVAARVVSSRLGLPQELDYMSGLLHDIGEARIYRIFDGLQIKPEQKKELHQLVQRYHCRAGAEVAMAWHLPPEIVDACAAHHDDSSKDSPHVRLVMLADTLVDSLVAPQLERFAFLGVDEVSAQALIEGYRDAQRSSMRARARS